MTGKDLKSLKESAAKAMLKGNWSGALVALQEARGQAPRDTHVALKIGDMLQRLGKKKEAVEAYKQAATLFAAAGFLVKAISVNKIILSLDPRDREVQSALAELYSEQRAERGIVDDPEPAPAAAPPGLLIQPQAALVVPEAAVAASGSAEVAEALDEALDDDAGLLEIQPLEFELPDIELARIDPGSLPRTPLLSDLSRDELEAVIEQMVVTQAAAGTLICREGEAADSMFIIVHGLVKITGRDLEGNPLWLTNLGEGEFFGEFGMLSDGRRHADVIASEDTELLQIGKAQLTSIAVEHPRVQDVLFAFYKERVVDTLLAKSPLTRSLSPEQRRFLLERAAVEAHEPGSMIIQEGDDGMHLYVIKSGEVDVYTELKDKRIDLAVLGAGDVFGEISVLTGAPATANVVARTRIEAIKFSRREVVEIARLHPQLAHRLSEMKEHRVHETVRRIQIEGFV